MTMRMPLDQVNTLGRNAQGVRLMHLKDNQMISSVSLVEHEVEELNEEQEEFKTTADGQNNSDNTTE